MIQSIFEIWLDSMEVKINAGNGIDLTTDRVPFGVESQSEAEELERQEKKKEYARQSAVKKALKEGKVCFLMYGGVGRNAIADRSNFEGSYMDISSENSLKRMMRLVNSMLSREPQENDYVFYVVPAKVKLVPKRAYSGLVSGESENTSAELDPAVAALSALPSLDDDDCDIEIATDYLESLKGKDLYDFIRKNRVDTHGYIFGSESVLKYVESVLGTDLVVTDEKGNMQMHDCFAYTLSKVKARLRYI